MRRHRGAGVPNISLTGIYGAERRQCRVLIESLGGNYTGNLEVNSSTRTTHLVCDLLPGNLHFSYLTEKMAVALDMGIPVVSSRWLKDSSANGSFLNESKYILDPESCFAPEPCSVEQLRSLPDPEAQASSSGHFLKHTTPGHSSVSSKGSACVSLAVKLVKEALGELPSTGAGSCLENSSVLSGSAGLIPETELPQLQILSPHGSVSAPVTRSDAREPASSTSESASAAAAPGSDDDIDITSALSHLSVKEDTPNSALRVPSPAALSMSNLSTVTIGHALSGAPTSQRTLQALLKHHALDKSSAVTFYRCVTLKTEFGRELQFTAGDITHGARMLYDVDPATGRREHALIVIKSIYSLETLPGDVWMGESCLKDDTVHQETGFERLC